ncbi:MAG: tRNA lysidine(34) synthetase TilS [Bacteroidales bacterium]|nr:tRNA lysidine(34) synthetase TilS [Bacteroidales bacterium]
MTLQENIKKTLSEAGFLPDGGLLTVALSGGADSVSLLLLLRDLGYDVHALHCNFELRGIESDADEAFCRRLCRQRDIPLTVHHFRTASYAHRHHLSIEMAARNLRYEWFEQQRDELGARAVCVAHHRDDNIETLLLNLIRGTGIHGLTGMSAVSGHVLRPLLNVSRRDLEAWLTSRNQEWITDRTNLDPDAAIRNKIRLQILPLMEEINPRVRETLAATATRIGEAEALYDDAVSHERSRVEDADGSLSVSALKQATSSATVLHEILHPRGYTAEQVRDIHQSMDGESGKLWESRDGWRLLRDRGRLLMEKDEDAHPLPPDGNYLPLEGLYEPRRGFRLLVRRQAIDPATFVIPRDGVTACFDLEKLTLPLTIRYTREGDRFQPFGMNGSRLVSDLLTDLKLSLFDKERQFVVCSGERIAWVVGQRVAAGYEVDANTRHVMTITTL